VLELPLQPTGLGVSRDVDSTFRTTGDGWQPRIADARRNASAFSFKATADSQQASFGVFDYNECTYSRGLPNGNFDPARSRC